MIVEESALYARPIAVHPSQSRRALHNLAAQGYDIGGGGMYEGMYVIVVLLPAGAPDPDWRAAPARRSASAGFAWPAFDWRVFVQLLCVLAIAGGVGYLGYSIWAGGDLSWSAPDLGGLSRQARDAWDSIAAPWQPLPRGEPVVEAADNVFRWPWESRIVSAPTDAGSSEWAWMPKNPVGDAVDSAGQMLMWLVYALLIVGALWLASVVAGIVRRVRR